MDKIYYSCADDLKNMFQKEFFCSFRFHSHVIDDGEHDKTET